MRSLGAYFDPNVYPRHRMSDFDEFYAIPDDFEGHEFDAVPDMAIPDTQSTIPITSITVRYPLNPQQHHPLHNTRGTMR